MKDLTVEYLLATAIVLFFGVGLHEFAHCKVADMAGDPTPRQHGRLTLNLFKHFELMGTVMMVLSSLMGFGLGWGKPAPCNPSLMKNPRWDYFSTVLAGPLSNVIQAVIFAVALRLGTATGILTIEEGPLLETQPFVILFLVLGVTINIGLALFNMIPVGFLDGAKVLGSFLPEKQRILWLQWNALYGTFVFIVLLIFSQFTGQGIFSVLDPMTDKVFRFLTGF